MQRSTTLNGGARLWRWRGFIAASVLRELKARYARSMLGAAWLVLPPLALIAIYALVFSRLMRGAAFQEQGPYAYAAYLCAGMITWQWFSDLLTRMAHLFHTHGALLKKTDVPWTALLCVEFFVATAGFLIQLLLFMLFLAAVGLWPGFALLKALPLLAVQAIWAVGLGLLLGVLNVFFRDVQLGLPLALQVLFWLTPIVYPQSVLPAEALPWLSWNLLTPLVQGYQSIILPSAAPSLHSLSLNGSPLLALLLLMWAIHLVRRNLVAIRDEL